MTLIGPLAGDPGPFEQEGLFRRVAPFAAVVLLALTLASVDGTDTHIGLFILAGISSLLLVLLALFLPWRRLPRWSQAIVPIAYLPVVGLLRDATGGPTSYFTPLVLLPTLLLALYGRRSEVIAAVLATAVVLGVPPLLDPGLYPTWDLFRGTLTTAVCAFVGLVVNALVRRLRDSALSVAAAEAQARESRDMFRGVLEAATQFCILATDAQGRITIFNEGASRMLGYEPEEVLGQLPTVLHDPDEIAHLLRERGLQTDLETGPESGLDVMLALTQDSGADVRDWTFIRNTGERLTVSLAMAANRNTGGELMGIIGIAHDVTEQRRNEAQIQEQAQRAALLNDLTHAIRQDLDPTSVLNRAVTALGECLSVDRVVVRVAAHDDPVGALSQIWTRPGLSQLPTLDGVPAGILRLWGQSPVEGSVLAIFDAEDDARLKPSEAREISAQYGIRGYLGAPMWVGARLMGWLTVHSVRGRTWTGNDLAILRALARTVGAALLQAQTYQQEHEIVRRLRELDQTKSDFVSSVSHELRTPLTSITGYLEMLVDGDAGALNADQLDLVQVVERNSRRLLALIEELLTLSRIESGAIAHGKDPVDLDVVLSDVHRAVLPLLAGRSLDVDFDLHPELGQVLGDAGQLEQVLFNLVTNAVKFTADGGRVRVAATTEDDRVTLSVADTGIGIPADEQDQLFSRFFRASSAREHAIQGTGLGLSIVKSIVEGHGGTIAVESEAGVGTTVTVELPLAAQVREPVGAA